MVLFLDFIEEWRNTRIRSSKGWRMCQDQIVRDHISPYLGSKRISKITPADISSVLMESQKKGHSRTTTRKIFAVMSKIFKDAVELYEYIQRSPVKRRFHMPKLTQKEMPYLDQNDSALLLEYVYSHTLFGEAVWLQSWAGLRVSEVQALEWKDIDFKRDLINIYRCYNRITDEIQPYTKNGSHHSIPLAPQLKTFLLKKTNKTGLICRNSSGGMMSYYSYRSFLNMISEKLNLKISSSHGLRHTFARRLKTSGASDEQIQRLLNHTTLASTRTYLHDTREDLFVLMKKIS